MNYFILYFAFPERSDFTIPRPHRTWADGSIYHIYNRGVHRTLIYKNDKDYKYFYNVMTYAKQHFDFDIIAYCLMPNHFHLVLRVLDAENSPISDVMKMICCRYSRIFNNSHRCSGHLFEGRFKSKYVDTEEYLLELLRYVHLNPVKASMVKLPFEYKYSSYNAYAYGEVNKLIDPYFIRDYFPHDTSNSFRNFTEIRLPRADYELMIQKDIHEPKADVYWDES